MSISLRVTPDVLDAKAAEINAEKAVVSGLLEQAKADISSLTGVWKSEASEVYQGKFKQVYADIDSILAILTEHVSDLTEGAGLYRRAEAEAKAASEGLPTSGVLKPN